MLTRSSAKRGADELRNFGEVPSTLNVPVVGEVDQSPVMDYVAVGAPVPTAQHLETEAQPHSPRENYAITVGHPNSHISFRSQVSGSSSRTTSTVRARRLAVEAQVARQQLERERKLCLQQKQVEELEMKAQLAALEVDARRSVSRVSSRTASWVSDVHNYHQEPITDTCGTAPNDEEFIQNSTIMQPHNTVSNFSHKDVNNSLTQCHSIVHNSNISLRDGNVPNIVPQNSLPSRTEKHKNAHFRQPSVTMNPSVTNNAVLSQNMPHSCLTNQLGKDYVQKQSSYNAVPSSHRCTSKFVELIPFSGKTTEWLMFKRTYLDTQNLFSPTENLARLRCALHGRALESVSSLLYTADTPDEVMNMLEQTFALPETIVLHEIALVRSLPKISYDLKDLNSFACRLRNCIAVINSLGQKDYLFSIEIFHTILSKLTPILYSQWKEYAYRCDISIPKLQLLSQFLDIEADKHNRFGLVSDYARRPNTAPVNNYIHQKQHVHAVTFQNSNISKLCRFCKNKHKLIDCNDFKALTFDDKWRWLRDAKICYKCLKAKAHRWKTCKIIRCGIDGCDKFHNPLLHPPPPPPMSHVVDSTPLAATSCNIKIQNNDKNPTVVISNITESLSTNTNLPDQSRVFLKIVPVEVSGPNGKYDTFALLDDGSTATLIDSEVARHIGASGPSGSIRVDGVAGMSSFKPIQYVQFSIKGKQGTEVFSVSNAKAIDSLSLYTQNICQDDIRHYTYLTDLAEYLVHYDATPKVLIGVEDWYLMMSHEVRLGTKKQPVASRTALGWVLHGRASRWTKPIDFVNHVVEYQQNDSKMDELVKEYFQLDSIGISKLEGHLNEEHKHAVQTLENTAKRLTSGRFEVGLLWRKDLPAIPDSYPHALSRFLSLEKRMARDPEFKNGYSTFMHGMLEKGYAEECTRDTYHDTFKNSTDNPIRWYLPHFPVIHPQKKKLRVVHDAAAKTSGVSLNSLLVSGPDLLQPLVNILFRFREGHVALAADVKEMFPQIRIREQDRNALRYLWRDNPRDDLKEYRMTSVIFGAACSPCIALYIKNRNAEELQESHPTAANAVIRDHYMDDFLGSLDQVHQASQLAADIVAVHDAAGWEMRGWVSNIPEALASIRPELRAELPESVDVGPEASVSTLGLKWYPGSDTFGFRRGSFITKYEKLTKRNILSHLMSLYDPLGLLIPLVIQGRILFQQTWRTGVDWDTELQPSTVDKWMHWSQQLLEVSKLKVPRWYRSGFQDLKIVERQLHVLADASEQAYACVAYWRFTFCDGSTKLTLIGGKARLAPLKTVSVPRLELQAALIAARYANAIVKGHEVHVTEIYLWSDSTTVLSWIRSDARKFKPFVANRIGEIIEITNPKDWKYIPGVLNIADFATRLTNREIDWNRWFAGPDYLLLPIDQWPKEPSASDIPPISQEFKPSHALIGLTHYHSLPSPVVPEPSHFSEWLRLVRSTVRFYQSAFKFLTFLTRYKCQNSMNIPKFTTTFPNAIDILRAEQIILRKSQEDSFHQELVLLRNSKPIPKTSKLYSLSPFLDEEGLLRFDSRIKHMKGIEYETSSPIILDGRHPSVQLLIRSYHIKAAHGFNETVYNELRQQYSILRCRNTIKKVSKGCQTCAKRKATPRTPPTGDLPEVRLEHHNRPFTNVGLDYFGPIEVSIGRRKEKRYVALYTCMTTRAVHLDLVFSLSADSAISSLRRFIARRGIPNNILSDNGTAFVGASRQLAEFYGESLEQFAANSKIKWSFIPPASPFMGGCWERLVRTIKGALAVTLKERAPKEELLVTLLHEAEALVNSRPLTYVVENGGFQSLTPFHFLIGASSNQQLPTALTDDVFCLRKEWQKVLRLSEHFWSRWLKEYLPCLRTKRPEVADFKNLEIGDVVLVVDPNLPRGVWPLGRITKLYPGTDGVVRVADVATKGGVLKRPTRKLALLEQTTIV